MKKYQTIHGLNYYLDETLYNLISINPLVFIKLNRIIEASEVFPVFILFIGFIILPLATQVSGWMLLLMCSCLFILACFVSLTLFLFRLTFVLFFLSIFERLIALFLDFIFALLFAIFILHQWYLVFIYISIRLFLSMIMTYVFGYRIKVGFNNKVAYYLLEN